MRPLRVAVGVVGGITGGPARYGVELVRAFLARPVPGGERPLEITVLTDRPDLLADTGVRCEHLPLGSSWAQPWWDNVAVPLALRRLRPDVYHGTKFALPLVGLPAGTAGVVSIHDLAVLAEPGTFGLAQRLQLRVHLAHAARAATRIVCVSRHAAADVTRRLGVDPARIAVVHNGVASGFRPPRDAAARAASRRRFGAGADGLIAFVGTAQPRKRVEVAIEAVRRLRDAGRDVTLAIAGRRRPGYEPDWLVSPPAFVRLLGEVGEEDLVALYGAADAMASPSTFEGFGLTFAEAMACGCPVVGVAATAVPEVVGDGGILVPAAEPAAVAEALGRILAEPGLRERLSAAALRRAGEFGWDRCAERTAAVYRAAAAVAAGRGAAAR